MIIWRLSSADLSFTTMSYPHLIFDRWKGSFLRVLWPCCAPPPINADGLTHLCEILAERAGGLALDGMVVHVVVVERGVVDPSCCGDYVVVGHAGLL